MFYLITPVSLGWIAGTALQLQQAQLWTLQLYVGLAAVFAAILVLSWRVLFTQRLLAPLAWQACVGFVLAGALAFALAGIRACHYLEKSLNPSLEGQTLQVVGLVANLPQRMDDSVRFRFEVESARSKDGAAVELPPQLLLGWYGNRLQGGHEKLQAPPADLHPGDRWQLTVRVKAPHGHINPHGFDYELWLWEQGLQATGYVRNGAKDVPPQWLGSTSMHPIEGLRQRQRNAIERQVEDRATAGIIAALLVGDQAAIERADWDLFRATGVAHLMAIKCKIDQCLFFILQFLTIDMGGRPKEVRFINRCYLPTHKEEI